MGWSRKRDKVELREVQKQSLKKIAFEISIDRGRWVGDDELENYYDYRFTNGVQEMGNDLFLYHIDYIYKYTRKQIWSYKLNQFMDQ